MKFSLAPDACSGQVDPLPPVLDAAEGGAPAGLRHWVEFTHCRVLLPHFAFAERRDALARLHRIVCAGPASCDRPAGFMAVFFARLLFAPIALRQLVISLRRYGAYVARHHAVPRWRQGLDLWHCSWHHNQFPRHYYWRKLFLLPRRETWLENLEHRQVTALLAHLNRRLPVARVTNKFRFFTHCLEHQLPTARVLAAWSGQGRLLTDPPDYIADDLFAKPLADYGSVDAIVIPFDRDAGTHRLLGEHLSWSRLQAALARRARRRGGLVLQPRIHNAPRNAVYGDTDLCNLRIVTARPRSGPPEIVAAFLRLPSSLTTLGHDRHILFASVEPGSGRLGTGRLRDITRGEFPFHPDTRTVIAGRILPGWEEMAALALRAHRSVPWMPFVGWDIIDSSEGVLVLEANCFWGADGLQLPGATPLGRTRFPEIYLEWFDHFHRPAAAPAGAKP